MNDSFTSPDFWLSGGKLRTRSIDSGGKKRESDTLYMRVRSKTSDRWLNLHTDSISLAAERAAQFWRDMEGQKPEDAVRRLSELGPTSAPIVPLPKVQPGRPMTVGEYIAIVEDLPVERIKARASSRRNYCLRLRQIAAEMMGIEQGKTKFCHRARDGQSSGASKWRRLVDAIPLEALTQQRIDAWLKSRRRDVASPHFGRSKLRIGKSPAELADVNETNLRSILRNTKAVFSPKIIAEVSKELSGRTLPSPIPFSETRWAASPVRAYRGEVDAVAIYSLAVNELLLGKTPSPVSAPILSNTSSTRKIEMFIALILGLCAGFRRREIDFLCRIDLNLKEQRVSVAKNPYFEPKTKRSARTIPLDTEVCQLLTDAIAQLPKSVFVLPGPYDPVMHQPPRYRRQDVFVPLLNWLRAHGLNMGNPIHALRKEYGSQVLRASDLTGARDALGHSTIMLTADCYAYFGKLKPVQPWKPAT